MSWPGGLFYTPAQQHWQLVLATSCMAASSFWTSRQELMPSEFPLTWATFRVQFSPNNPEEPDRNPWRNQKWKPLRYSFRWTKKAAQMQTCTCFSLEEHTLAGFQLWARLGAQHWGTWRIFQTTPDWNIPLLPKLSVWAQLCSIHPWSFFFFSFFSNIFRMDSNLNFSSIAYILLLLPYTINRYQIILIKYH